MFLVMGMTIWEWEEFEAGPLRGLGGGRVYLGIGINIDGGGRNQQASGGASGWSVVRCKQKLRKKNLMGSEKSGPLYI